MKVYQPQRLWFAVQSHCQPRQWKCAKNVLDWFCLGTTDQPLLTYIQWPADESNFPNQINSAIKNECTNLILYNHRSLATMDNNVRLFLDLMRPTHYPALLTFWKPHFLQRFGKLYRFHSNSKDAVQFHCRRNSMLHRPKYVHRDNRCE